MLRQELARKVSDVLDRLIASGDLPDAARVEFEIFDTKNPDHGDYSCNVALIAAKPAGMNPRAIGEKLQKALAADDAFGAVDIAGPGFLNFKLKPETISRYVTEVLSLGEKLPSALSLNTQRSTLPKMEVEFVSVNPNGPITVGSGRGAAFGDTYSRILQAAGNDVTREYYINDGVNSEQMHQFAMSVRHFCQTKLITDWHQTHDLVRHRRFLAVSDEFILWREQGHGGDTLSTFKESVGAFVPLVKDTPDAPWRSELASRLLELANDSGEFGFLWALKERYKFSWLDKEYVLPPEGGYSAAEYVLQIAEDVIDKFSETTVFLKSFDNKELGWFQDVSQEMMIERQRSDLHRFGIDFDIWFSEQKDLHDLKKVDAALKWLEENGNAYRAIKPRVVEAPEDDKKPKAQADEDEDDVVEDGKEALWLASCSNDLGDDKDRVLLRADGRPTYLAAEVAYLKDKFDRGYDKCYLVLGPDHHGYIGRTYAVVKALGKEPGKDFEIIIFQIVRFVKDGKPAPMRKRDGNIYELRDLITELGQAVSPNATPEEQQVTGADVARFFYLMRSHETHMDFDIDLATKQSDENPVFYVQYAHARICGVIRKATEAGIGSSVLGIGPDGKAANSALLTHPRELALIKKIIDLPEEVQRCAKDFGVHRIATFAVELARSFHAFYDACRVIQPEEPELSQARLALAKAAQIGLKSALDLLGVSAPEKMERAVAEA